MSERHLFYVKGARTAVKLAIQLGREGSGRYRGCDRVADDAETIVKAGLEARRAVMGSKNPEAAYAKAIEVADTYNAQIVRYGDEKGVFLGLRFWSGLHGHSGSVFVVS